MANHSTLAVIERYEEYRHALNELISSIATGIANPALRQSGPARDAAMRCVSRHYPFIDLLYVLDASGVQITPSLAARKGHPSAGLGWARGVIAAHAPISSWHTASPMT